MKKHLMLVLAALFGMVGLNTVRADYQYPTAGAVRSAFSVNRDTKVAFSHGNLQYKASKMSGVLPLASMTLSVKTTNPSARTRTAVSSTSSVGVRVPILPWRSARTVRPHSRLWDLTTTINLGMPVVAAALWIITTLLTGVLTRLPMAVMKPICGAHSPKMNGTTCSSCVTSGAIDSVWVQWLA